MKSMRDTLTLVQLWLLIMWPISATAAQLSFSRQLAQTDVLLDLALTLLLSSLSGLTGLLAQMKKEYIANGKIDRIGLFIASNMLGSVVSGITMYFAADHYQFSRGVTAGSIIVAAFTGTWFLDKLTSKLGDKINAV